MQPPKGAEVHNAKRCTVDGRDCWIASIEDERGFLYRHPTWGDNVQEFSTRKEALGWARKRLTLLGVGGAPIRED